MANPQLLEFIRTQIKLGTPIDEIKKSLATAGWPMKYIEEGVLEVNSTPQTSAPLNQNILPSEPSNLISGQTYSSINQPINTSYPNSTTVVSLEPSKKGGRKIWVALLVFILVALIGGAISAAYIYKDELFEKAPYTEKDLFSGLVKTADQINSSTYEFNSSGSVGTRDADALPWENAEPLSPELINQYKNDNKRAINVTDILGATKYERPPYQPTLQAIANTNSNSYYKIEITDPKTNQIYDYKITDNGNNFALTVTFETDDAISALKISYKYSSASTPISGKQVTFTKDSGNYFYFPSTPPKPVLLQLGEILSIIQPDMSASSSFGASTDWTTANGDWKFNFSGMTDLGNMKYEIGFDALRKNSNYYLKLNAFPSVFLMFVGSPGITKNQWYKLDTNTSSSTENANVDYFSEFKSVISNNEKTYEENRKKFIDGLKKIAEIADGEHLFTFKNAPKSEKIDGRKLYRYDLKLNKDAILPFYKKIISESKSLDSNFPIFEDAGFITYLQSSEFNEIFDFYDKNAFLTIWVDPKGFPGIISYKIRIIPPDSAAQLAGKQINIVFNLVLSKINEPLNIEEPKDAKSFEELFNLGSSELMMQSRDSARASDLAGLNSTLALYVSTVAKPKLCTEGKIYKSTEGSRAIDGTGWLPVNLNEITGGSPIGNLPIDPTNNSEYYYSYACDNSLNTYEFNTKLESKKYNVDLGLPEKDGGDNNDLYEIGTHAGLALPTLKNRAQGNLDTFVSCLNTKGVKFYGASWCPHCENQKKLFGDSAKLLPYVECSASNQIDTLQVCKDAKIDAYPTWVFPDNTRTAGEVTLETLANKSGCFYTSSSVSSTNYNKATPTPIVNVSNVSVAAKGRDARRITDLKMMQNALELYFNVCSKYPSDKIGLIALTNPSLDPSCDTEPIVTQIPHDPGGEGYYYCATSSGNRYTLGATLENLSNPVLSQQIPNPKYVNESTFPCAPKDSSGIIYECHGSKITGVYCVTI